MTIGTVLVEVRTMRVTVGVARACNHKAAYIITCHWLNRSPVDAFLNLHRYLAAVDHFFMLQSPSFLAQLSPDPLTATPTTSASSLHQPNTVGDIFQASHLDLVITTILPATATLLAIAFDLLARVSYPKSVKRVAYTLSKPFRDFFTLADVDQSTPCPIGCALWNSRLLALGSVFQSIGWLAVLAYKEHVADWQGSFRAGVTFLAWVSSNLPITRHGPDES